MLGFDVLTIAEPRAEIVEETGRAVRHHAQLSLRDHVFTNVERELLGRRQAQIELAVILKVPQREGEALASGVEENIFTSGVALGRRPPIPNVS